MGFDIEINRLRPKHYDETKTLEENFNHPNAKGIFGGGSYYSKFKEDEYSDDEMPENGVLYRRLYSDRLPKIYQDDEDMVELFNSFDTEFDYYKNFVYIAKMDW